ncbi:hypothetical protein LTR84_000338 [Exophiala bonariae]|uniref:Mannosyltransferase n=1 Tax=Exophiala bonariae TaxID=1690606 RepID=A0AAV9NSX1_9EURO|nr:hypothetical protein LTR84_000338 [Exophiala bonariae]
MASARIRSSKPDTKANSSKSTSQDKASNEFIFTSQNALLFLLALRLFNALTIRTFFQPDEYFQALEPAWQLAFGADSGAWITWEWREHLRSAVHPALFALAYRTADSLAGLLKLSDATRAEVLLAAPKTLQACFAALGDFYTWKLAGYIYGRRSASSTAVLVLTVVSPWQWFTSTRTFSNSLETTLTVIGLYNWPWHWSAEVVEEPSRGAKLTTDLRVRDDGLPAHEKADEVTRLRKALLCAALATVLRPTNLLVWASLSYFAFVRRLTRLSPTISELTTFLREAVLCGSTVLLLSTVVDRLFYQAWVLPPYNFLLVNVVQSLATFYGSNDWHYYISQGYPLLMTTALPFTLVGMYRSFGGSEARSYEKLTPVAKNTLYLLSIISTLVPAAFSNIAHKEVRFISPLLPALHIVSGQTIAPFFEPLLRIVQTSPNTNSSLAQERNSPSTTTINRLLLFLFLNVNLGIAYYTTQIHNSGVIELTSYLRSESTSINNSPNTTSSPQRNLTLGMLMPCHSTPWRSHLQHAANPSLSKPGIKGWALTCEPPLHVPAAEKAKYRDEADAFYDDPSAWLKQHMSRSPPLITRHDGTTGPASSLSPGFFAPDFRAKRNLFDVRKHPQGDAFVSSELEDHDLDEWYTTHRGRRPWPMYLAFFAQLEPTLQAALRGSGYVQCKRIFNSHWHDDWRRTGDVVVWCRDYRRVLDAGAGVDGAAEDVEQRVEQGDVGGGESGSADVGKAESESTARPTLERVVEKPFWKARDRDRD